MNAIKKIITISILLCLATTLFAQRMISGIVYKDGKPQGGVLVEANKARGSAFTDPDGKYELEITGKTKYLTFTFLNQVASKNIENDSTRVIDFSFDGEIVPKITEPTLVIKSMEQLQADRDIEFINNYTAYRELIKQEKYTEALPMWRKIYQKYPIASAQPYIDGIKIFETVMNQSTDINSKLAYLDTMMMIYDRRITYFYNDNEILGRKAEKYLSTIFQSGFIEEKTLFQKNIKKGYTFAEQAINAAGNQTEPAVMVLYMQASQKMFETGEISKSELFSDFDKVITILWSTIPTAKTDQAVSIVLRLAENNNLLECNFLSDYYSPLYGETPNDTLFLRKVSLLMQKGNCNESELFIKVSEKLFALAPTHEAAFSIANLFVKKNNIEKAFEYYERAYSTPDCDSITRSSYYFYASQQALQTGKFEMARDLASESLKYNPRLCQALILTGDIYYYASQTYSTDNFERSTIYWLAADYYEKALKFSPCNTTENNKKNIFTNYFPNKEEIFFRNLTQGQPYHIGGWINETTTVRARK